jgi:large subunit ribosomal protein L21
MMRVDDMYAVIESGGKQYRVSQGDRVRVERLEGDVGAKVVFDQVLMVGEGDEVKVGQPNVDGAVVEAEITDQNRAKKVVVFKFKQRKKYRRKQGHRQPYTELKVTEIKA